MLQVRGLTKGYGGRTVLDGLDLPAAVTVHERGDAAPGTAVLTVDNDAAPGSRPMHGSGKGLIGMRERAAVYGGTVDAGPTATGWRVRAVLRWDEDDEGTTPWQMPM